MTDEEDNRSEGKAFESSWLQRTAIIDNEAKIVVSNSTPSHAVKNRNSINFDEYPKAQCLTNLTAKD